MYGTCALRFPLMRSIHPRNFITIASIVLEICSGQNSSMKINKGQLIKNKMSVCKTAMPPYCHIDTGSGTVHLLITKELIGKYLYHLRKEQGLKPNQFHKGYSMLLKDRKDNLIFKSYRSMFQV